LLRALPTSKTTLSNYVKTALEERKLIIKSLVQSAASKVAVSVDVWTSSNYLSFLGVVAHFVGR
jgi:ribosomal protein S3AE